ncbi:MAG TPA: DUF4350 domain-containing protein, partial [Mycobacteriales bacterium]|nr:DUF4350 domain-containing protein [Mycobacteriales bacterium]
MTRAHGRWITAALLGAAAVALLAQLLVRETSVFGGGPRGPRGSSYAVGPTGLSKYAQLLRDHGHEVSRRRQPLDVDSALDPRDALVVLDAASLSPQEGDAIARFVDAGGRAVVGGRDPQRWLPEVLPDGPTWVPGGQAACRSLVHVAEDVGVTDVVLTSSGHWDAPGATLPFLACDGRISATVASPGEHGGRLVLLADSGPIQNAYLTARDDTALGLGLVADRHRVVFDEQVHGFSAPDGVGALPPRVQVAL